MSKRKVPAIADIIDDCLVKLWDALQGKDILIDVSKVKDIAATAIAIDKNDRDLKIALKENIVPSMTDDELAAELARTKGIE